MSDKIREVLKLLIEASHEFNDVPWELGFSGGKDSTVVLSLLVEAIRRGAEIPKLYVVYADTLVEHPELRREALETLESLKDIPNVVPVRLTPREDFVSMMVERGYPAPSFRFRWCMARLKIRPMQDFLRSLGRYVQVSGIRAAESDERTRRYAAAGKVVRGERPIVMPILDWTTEDVFNYLKMHKRWDGKPFDYLLKLYGVEQEGCGCALYTDVRFGCWVCTVVRIDKMPTPPILKRTRERILDISRDPRYREFEDGKAGQAERGGQEGGGEGVPRSRREVSGGLRIRHPRVEGKVDGRN